jgi:phospholipid transport system substrate-binding protein
MRKWQGWVLSMVLGAAAAPIVAASGGAAPVTQVDASGPGQLIQSASQLMLQDLEAHRSEYRKDPALLRQLVDRVLLPYFDTEYAARLVLGKHWPMATAEQRRRFIDGFYQSLLRNYGSALIDFTADRMSVLPFRGDAAATTATIMSKIRKSDGSIVAVNYSMRRTAQGWKAWDVVIEGISYVKSFRDDFGAEIEQQGLDSLIQRLESQASSK